MFHVEHSVNYELCIMNYELNLFHVEHSADYALIKFHGKFSETLDKFVGK